MNHLTKLKIHYGGSFVRRPELKYVGGVVYKPDEGKVDPDLLCYKDIVDDLVNLGCDGIKCLWYMLPNHSMSNGLKPLRSDNDVIKMAEVLFENKNADVFVEHIHSSNHVGPNSKTTHEELSDDDDEIYDLESDVEERVELFDIDLISDKDDPEVIESLFKSQDHIQIPVEVIGADNMARDKGTRPAEGRKTPGGRKRNRGRTRVRRRKKTIVTEQEPAAAGDSSILNDSMYHGDPDDVDSDDPRDYEPDNDTDEYFWRVEDDTIRVHNVRPIFDPTTDIPIFACGMEFKNYEAFKEAIANYSIKKGCVLEWLKNDSKCQRLQCSQITCKWYISASLNNSDRAFTIKAYTSTHNCYRQWENPMCTSVWLAKYLQKKINSNPLIKLRELKDSVYDDLKLKVQKSMVGRAKRIVLTQLEGNYMEEYGNLMGYRDVLLEKNPDNTVIVNYERYINEPNPLFKSIYICLAGCKKGWKEGCRPIIGIDGTFLKGMCKGILLTATGRDGNNQMFPIAWAVVDSESNETWGWFLCQLKKDLDLKNGNNLTIVSDQHKVIISSVKTHLGEAEHRHCVRHLYSNWAKNNRGSELRNLFWAVAKSTYPDRFEINMKELAEKCLPEGFNEIACLEGKYWCKAFFKMHSKCDIVHNNLSETFNGWILEARRKSIITMLEEIRHMVMERIAFMRNFAFSWEGNVAPRVVLKLKKIVDEAFEWKIMGNGADEYEIAKGSQTHVVNLSAMKCTCRRWDLTGIPCPHAICALHSRGTNFEDVVSHWYKKETYIRAYSYPVDCIQGMETWSQRNTFKLMPPPFRKTKGRPRRNRIKARHEPKKVKKDDIERLSRKGTKIHCRLCGEEGHNKTTCAHKNDPNFKRDMPKVIHKNKKSNEAPPQPRIIFNVREAFCGPNSTENGGQKSKESRNPRKR